VLRSTTIDGVYFPCSLSLSLSLIYCSKISQIFEIDFEKTPNIECPEINEFRATHTQSYVLVTGFYCSCSSVHITEKGK